jgi:hypothetical protein
MPLVPVRQITSLITVPFIVAFAGNAKRVIDEAGADPQLHTLRMRRNALIHSDLDSPAVTVDQQWSIRGRLEEDARLAVELVFRVFYANASV